MSKPPQVRNDILSEASTWFVELNEDPQSHSTRAAFDQWLRRSPEHVHAFLQVSAHWEENATRPPATIESVEDLIALAQTDTNVIKLAHPAREANGKRFDSWQARARWPLVWAASIVLSLAAGSAVWHYFFADVYSTGVGEQHAITLADGSTVELNALSRLRVRYTSLERRVDLLEGQALFRVARDKLRPFTVQSHEVQVRAIGTQFDVYHKRSGTIVTVVEGSVAVVPVNLAASTIESGERADHPPSPKREVSLKNKGVTTTDTSSHIAGAGNSDTPAAQPPNEVYLVAGEQLTVGADSAGPPQLQHTDAQAATAWSEHRLIFKDAPLSEVVTEFNRYSRRPLVITDPTIAATRISGSFSSSDPAALLSFLSEIGFYRVHETFSDIEISRK